MSFSKDGIIGQTTSTLVGKLRARETHIQMTHVQSKKSPTSHMAAVNNRHEQSFHAELQNSARPGMSSAGSHSLFPWELFQTFSAPKSRLHQLKISKWPSLVLQSKQEYPMSLPPTACSHVARICASGFTFTSIPLFRGRSSEVHCSTCDLMSRLHSSRCLAQDCIFSSFSTVSSPAAYTYA